ncbi:MAG: hypothetical protein MJZ66_04095 [Bacteroidales bacterium]|nr:hypothetical protein [Bacteroidales bacterium]
MEIEIPYYTEQQNRLLSEIAELQREISGISINPNYFLDMAKACKKLQYRCERYLYLYCRTEKSKKSKARK